jgi:hypothetical protein
LKRQHKKKKPKWRHMHTHLIPKAVQLRRPPVCLLLRQSKLIAAGVAVFVELVVPVNVVQPIVRVRNEMFEPRSGETCGVALLTFNTNNKNKTQTKQQLEMA